MPTRQFFVYILASRSRTLYVGVTGDLPRRLEEHRRGDVQFTRRYRIHRLVFAEEAPDAYAALSREKQIKRWSRAKKIALIESLNPAWEELVPAE